MASLGFEKSYRETVVLMTRSYLDKLSAVSSPEPLSSEVTKEREEVCTAVWSTGLYMVKIVKFYKSLQFVPCLDSSMLIKLILL